MKEFLERVKGFVPQWVRNKFVLTGALFLLWVLLFDPISLVDLAGEKRHLWRLEREKTELEEKIERTNKRIDAFANPDSLVKVAREQFYFQSAGEEIFIIEE